MIDWFDGKRLLFIGDSITDCGRREDDFRQLGNGYVSYVSDFLAAMYTGAKVEIVNRGIGGDRVIDLQARWNEDVIALHPDWLSVSIGINDVWRGLSQLAEERKEAVPVDTYRAVYRDILSRAVAETGARLILMETSIIDEDAGSKGNRLLAEYNRVIRELAGEFDAFLVPINSVFHDALKKNPGTSWTTDGVHPRPGGHMLMAVAWLRTMNLLTAE